MTTIEDKLNLFSRLVFERIEKQSEDQRKQAEEEIALFKEAELKRVEEITRQIIAEQEKKAEAKSIQIISQASLMARQALLARKRELLNETVAGLTKAAEKFTEAPEYKGFLENSIAKAVRQLDGEQQLLFYFTARDISANERFIRDVIVKSLRQTAVYTVHAADNGIIGGCICVNGQGTRRVDCTLASRLADRRDMIGQMVMERLDQAGGDEYGK